VGRQKLSADVVPLLECSHVSKIFGATVALQDVSMELRRGQIIGLLGENGAGKSTLIKILAGVHQPDSGYINVGGRQLPAAFTPEKARELGLTFIHQNPALFDSLSVEDNLGLYQGFPTRRFGIIDRKTARMRSRSTLENLNLGIDPEMTIDLLPYSLRSSIALAAALDSKSKVAVFDEPTATLSAAESANLYERIKKLAATGCGVIFVSHRIDEVMELCDRVVVLRDGRIVGQSDTADLTKNELVEMIVGTHVETLNATTTSSTTIVLDLDSAITASGSTISLRVREGEIVGIGGSVGAGHEELASQLFTQSGKINGKVTFLGKDYKTSSPSESLKRGVGLVPGNRNREGLASGLSAGDNIFLNPSLIKNYRRRIYAGRQESAITTELMVKYGVNPVDPTRELATFSGGNAQKILLARWLQAKLPLTILIEPTAGIDVGARAAVHALIQKAAKSGQSFLVASSDLEELSVLCQQVFILNHRNTVSEFGQPISSAKLIAAAIA
jgi:ribose transport system ATP-binding protein